MISRDSFSPAPEAGDDALARAISEHRARVARYKAEGETKKARAEAKRERKAHSGHASHYTIARVGAFGLAAQERAARHVSGSGVRGPEPTEETIRAPKDRKPTPHPLLVARNVLASRAKLRRSATRRKAGAR